MILGHWRPKCGPFDPRSWKGWIPKHFEVSGVTGLIPETFMVDLSDQLPPGYGR